MPGKIEFFFFIGSTYAYLTVSRIAKLAREADVEVNWRLFNVREIMIEMGNIPFGNKPVKRDYMQRDIERRAAKLDVEYRTAPRYPVDPDLLANKVDLVAAAEGWCPEYANAIYRAWFLENKPIGDRAVIASVLDSLGRDAEEILTRAEADEISNAFARETEIARDAGIFGAPSFLVDGELFWGDDRLEDAIAACSAG